MRAKKWTADRKLEVVLAGLRNEESIVDMSRSRQERPLVVMLGSGTGVS